MKATKITLPNGKERILIEVKPKEYEAVENAFTNAYTDTPGAAEKEEKRMDAFANAQTSPAESFNDFVDRKDAQAG